MPDDTKFTATITANGTTSIETEPGQYAIHAGGTWGSGTLSVQWNDGTNAAQFPSGSLTADGLVTVSTGVSQIDLVLSGATGPSIIVTGARI